MSNASDTVTPENIARCETLIRPYVRRTPIMEIDGADVGVKSSKLCLKLELLQHSGSFKARGAFANLLDAQGARGLAWLQPQAATTEWPSPMRRMTLRVPAKIFVPSVASPTKVRRIREYGADLVIEGDRYADALAASEAWVQQAGVMPVHAFDQDETMLGQGTIGLELGEQAPDIDTLLVPVGGGGLIAGIAAWYAGRLKIVGVEPLAAPTLTKALEAGHPVDAEAGGLAADLLAPRRVGKRVFPIAMNHVRGTVLVSDEAIRQAQNVLWQTLRIVAEPGGAAAFAALLSDGYKPQTGERVAVIISGGNTTAVDFDR